MVTKCICDLCKEELKEVNVVVKDTKIYVVCNRCKGELKTKCLETIQKE